MSITLATLTKHTEKEITYEHKTTKKERKDGEIRQYEIIQYDCDAGVSNTMSSYQDTITEYRNIHKQRTAQTTWRVQKARTVQLHAANRRN